MKIAILFSVFLPVCLARDKRALRPRALGSYDFKADLASMLNKNTEERLEKCQTRKAQVCSTEVRSKSISFDFLKNKFLFGGNIDFGLLGDFDLGEFISEVQDDRSILGEFPFTGAFISTLFERGSSKIMVRETIGNLYSYLQDVFPKLSAGQIIDNILNGSTETKPSKTKQPSKHRPKGHKDTYESESEESEEEDQEDSEGILGLFDDLLDGADDSIDFFLSPFDNPNIGTAVLIAFSVLIVPFGLRALDIIASRLFPQLTLFTELDAFQLLLSLLFPIQGDDPRTRPRSESLSQDNLVNVIADVEEGFKNIFTKLQNVLISMDEDGIINQDSAMVEFQCQAEVIYCEQSALLE